MRLRTHILTSALLGAVLYPRAPRKAALLLAGGVLLDADHYLLYALRSGKSIFHTMRVTLPLVWLFGWRWPALRPLAIGVTLHLALDVSPLRLDWRVWRRADGRCECCGRLGLRRGINYVNPPRAGGSR